MVAVIICRLLFKQEAFRLDSLALPSAGSNNAAKMAMMAITTSNSTSVNPHLVAKFFPIDCSSDRPDGKVAGFIGLRIVISTGTNSRLAMQKKSFLAEREAVGGPEPDPGRAGGAHGRLTPGGDAFVLSVAASRFLISLSLLHLWFCKE